MQREACQKRYPYHNNLWKLLKEMGQIEKRGFFWLLLQLGAGIAAPVLLVAAPARVVQLLAEQCAYGRIFAELLLLLGGLLLLNASLTISQKRMEHLAVRLYETCYKRRMLSHLFGCEIRQLEESESRERMTEILHGMEWSDGSVTAGIPGLFQYTWQLFTAAGGLLLYTLAAARLHPVYLLLLGGLAGLNCLARGRAVAYEWKQMDGFWKNHSRFFHLKELSIDRRRAKDLRLYQLSGWFEAMLKENTDQASAIYDKVQMHHFYGEVFACLAKAVQELCAYGYLIYCVGSGRLNAAGFVAYLGVTAGFGRWVEQLTEALACLKKVNGQVAVARAFLEENEPSCGDSFKEAKREEPSSADASREAKREEAPCANPSKETKAAASCSRIRFEDVSFGYGDQMVFEHFSLELTAGERIALVGRNGAGKTTLVKLLCGLYPLAGGRILLDGQDLARMEPAERSRWFSVLFQEVSPLPFSIGENVACRREYDRDRAAVCLQQAKLWQKVQALPDGMDTVLTKILSADGVSLSGGEAQRLLLARALYHDAPVLILDEPTAALDPLAESSLYEEYAGLCRGKISLFISHRLSSTRFCDRICYLEDGKILEEGTHEALLARKGRYAHMYRMQAHYYQKEVMRHEAGL